MKARRSEWCKYFTIHFSEHSDYKFGGFRVNTSTRLSLTHIIAYT